MRENTPPASINPPASTMLHGFRSPRHCSAIMHHASWPAHLVARPCALILRLIFSRCIECGAWIMVPVSWRIACCFFLHYMRRMHPASWVEAHQCRCHASMQAHQCSNAWVPGVPWFSVRDCCRLCRGLLLVDRVACCLCCGSWVVLSWTGGWGLCLVAWGFVSNVAKIKDF